MNVKVINISPDLEDILGFLYPTYTITDSVAVCSKFITHKNIVSKAQRDALDYAYNDCIFISTQIFDEVWDAPKVIDECIRYARTHLHSRRTKLEPQQGTFIEDCVNFIVGNINEEEESTIFQLFDNLGSNTFPIKYFEIIETIPYQQVFAALTTFISKLDKNSPNVFYKKKAFLLKDRVDKNIYTAIDNYNQAYKGDGIAECKFIMDLFV